MRPYYADALVQLWQGDYRDVLPHLEAPVDLIVTDPPYGETALEWDRWPDQWPQHLIDRAPAMWCFGSLRMFLTHREEFQGWTLSRDLVWEKNNGTGFATDRFRRVHEHAVHWYRGRWRDIYHQTPRVARTGADKSTRRSASPRHTGALAAHAYVDDGTRLARSVLRAASVRGAGVHETQKPQAILVPLISYGCPPGGVILDPFAGSAASLIAARSQGRRAIGVEKREAQCAAAAALLARTKPPL